MKYYFQLQYRILKRKLKGLGINPALGMLLALGTFIVLSKYLFYKTTYAEWIYVFFGLAALLKLGETKRNDHLHSIFRKRDYYRIRIIENAIIALPFLLYLLYEGSYFMLLALAVLALLLATINFKQNWNITIPTPFRKFPFEFIVGFRKSLLFIALAYFLAIKAIQVGNFYLGLFSLGLVFFINISFYFKPESVYFAWIFSLDSKLFLRKKIFHAGICSSILTFPIVLALFIAFTDEYILIGGIQIAGYVFLITMILAKYSAFPREMSLPQAILFGLCIWFPPMLLIIIPIFFKQATKRLKPILE